MRNEKRKKKKEAKESVFFFAKSFCFVKSV